MTRAKIGWLGYIFSQKNIELMNYLVGFTRDEPLPNQNQFMEVVNLYAENKPWQIFEGANTYTCYFITPQKKKNSKWKRVTRTVGKGTWKPQGKGKEVFDNKGRLMGYVKNLKYTKTTTTTTYHVNDNKNANGEWLMTEYSLYDGYLGAREIKNRGYVICKIKKKGKSTINENMNDVEELIDSSLQLKDDIIVEEDVGDEVFAIMDKEDDGDRNVEC
ncbi:hypothetical protein H5410_038481 [Solanum commersonii]|uniref:NAC domain-containing protein n=1 Tax=Solanum commersonii TaxID=4109 RepID=A0A9J5YA79_SOLCO|nr:hypothetical protein H5410_038481 [Solanum commersonii]